MSTSREFTEAAGIVIQTSCFSAPSGRSIACGSGLDPGMSNGVPSWNTPLARRSANLFCCARSRSISIEANPQG
jgi:hypothetical protein